MNKSVLVKIGLSALVCTSTLFSLNVFASGKTQVVGKGRASSFHSDFQNFAMALAEQDALSQCQSGPVKVDPSTWKITYETGYHCSGRGYCDPDAVTAVRAEADFECDY